MLTGLDSALVQHYLVFILPVIEGTEKVGGVSHREQGCLICLSPPDCCFLVPFLKELVGRLIGKQGRFMSYLRQASGAKIYVSTLPYFRDSQVCHIEGEWNVYLLMV